MKLLCFFLLLSVSIFAQTKALEIKIDSIRDVDTKDGERKFFINYSLRNTTNHKINFLFKPERISPSNSGSMSNLGLYKIYENEHFLELGSVFGRLGKDLETGITLDWKDTDENEQIKKDMLEHFIVTDSMIVEYQATRHFPSEVSFRQRNILDELITLNPKEIKSYQIVVFWNKDPYFLHEEQEFVLDSKNKHYLELTMIAMQEQFKILLTAEEFESLMSIPNFVTGVFESNKMEINFGSDGE